MNHSLLVLGASGFLGHHLTQCLLDLGHTVTGLDIVPSSIAAPRYRHVVGSAADRKLLGEVLPGHDAVIDLANSAKPLDAKRFKRDFFRQLTSQAHALAEACKASATKKLVFVSTAGEMYGNRDTLAGEDSEDPHSAYGFGKLANELLLEELLAGSATTVTTARVANPFGNSRSRHHGFVDVAINKALAGEALEIWGSDQIVRDYIHIKDVCSALALLATRPTKHRVYNVCRGISHSLADIVTLINAQPGDAKLHPAVLKDHVVEILASRPCPERLIEEFSWQPAVRLEDYIKARMATPRQPQA